MKKQLIQWRAQLLVFLTHRLALPLLKLIRKPECFPYTLESLLRFAPGTLGYDMAIFLQQRELLLLPYYAKHDIKHVLLQYDTTGEGEVCLQCFMLGNRHISFPVLATVVYGFITMPEYWKIFGIAFKRGKRAIPISEWNWFELLQEPTQSLIQKIDAC
ncbi:MAG: hypothetical protein WCH29_02665 [Chitinophagaceae bacterium]